MQCHYHPSGPLINNVQKAKKTERENTTVEVVFCCPVVEETLFYFCELSLQNNNKKKVNGEVSLLLK